MGGSFFVKVIAFVIGDGQLPIFFVFLKKNIRITDDGKIEIIKMKRKYSLMLPNPSITEGVYD